MKLERSSPVVALFLFIFVFLVYAATFRYPFFFDDSHFIQSNFAIQTPANLLRIWTSASFNSSSPEQWGYRPFTTFLHSLAWLTGGGATWPFHVLKKALFATACFFLYLVWMRIWSLPGFFPREAPRFRVKFRHREWSFEFNPRSTALLLAILFAIHPANNEIVNYISATTTLLSGCCYVTAYYFYLRFRESNRAGFVVASLAMYSLAVFAKEEGITLCGVVLLSEIFLPRAGGAARDTWKNRVGVITGYFVVGAILAMILRLQFAPSSSVARGFVPPWEYFMTQWRAYVHYLKLLIWPWDLNADNLAFGFSRSFFDVKVLAALAANLLFLGVAWSQRKRYPVFLFALLWFYIAISPASSVVPLAEPVNDRRMFLAYFGLVGIFPWLLRGLEKVFWSKDDEGRGGASGAILLLIFCGLLVGVQVRSHVWSSTEALWQDTLDKNPYSPRAMNNLAQAYMIRADWTKALELLETCGRYEPNYPVCRLNHAIVLDALGRAPEAEQKYIEAITLDPQRVETKNFYATFLGKFGRYDSAIALYREVDRMTGGLNMTAKLGWARSALKLGRNEEADSLLKEARRVFGDRPEVIALLAQRGMQ